MSKITIGILAAVAFSLNLQSTRAGSATWKSTPMSGVWDIATNWTPKTVPNTLSDTATFGVSTITTVANAGPIVGELVFQSGASAYTITPFPSATFELGGAGITNNSGVGQNFIADFSTSQQSRNVFMFSNSASAGNSTRFTTIGSPSRLMRGGLVTFADSSSAGGGTFIAGPATGSGEAGIIYLTDSSTAANGTFISSAGDNGGDVEFDGAANGGSGTFVVEGGSVSGAGGGYTVFFGDSAKAGSGTYTMNAGAVAGAYGGRLEFDSTSSADNATLIANGGSGFGGSIVFTSGLPTGGTARAELFGNGNLDISSHYGPGVTIGSLEGDGLVFLGANNLTIGSNNVSTTFAGVIQDTGSIAKIGTGNLTLTNANTYTGGTVINGGILLANNTTGSGTGKGSVRVDAGTFGGSGIVAGAVLVGTGTGASAFLAPGARGVTPGTLTIRKNLTLKSDSTYKETLDSRASTADAVRVKGVRIQGASILFNDLGTNVLPTGTVLTIINNLGTKPISGTFSNLADGGSVTVGDNTFQANYEGGDGNDLTLTVVP